MEIDDQHPPPPPGDGGSEATPQATEPMDVDSSEKLADSSSGTTTTVHEGSLMDALAAAIGGLGPAEPKPTEVSRQVEESEESKPAEVSRQVEESEEPKPSEASQQIEEGEVEESQAVDSETKPGNVLVGQNQDGEPENVTHAAGPEAIESDAEEGEIQEGDEQGGQAEWEADSSPYESSSDDTSSDSSDDSDDSDEDDKYVGLSQEEMARILMEQDSHDEPRQPTRAQVRTTNEKPEEVVPKPNVEIKDGMKMELLGEVLHIVESIVVVKGATDGEYQVLDTESVVCGSDRAVLGAISDVIGRVEEPMYTVRFTNAQEIQDAGLSTGTKVYYPVDFAKFVFTKPLRKMKFTDASNLYDEEIGEDEQEFSDDEKEREHKRKKKDAAKRRRNSDSGGKGAQPFSRNGVQGEPVLNYDDEDVGPYRPLSRPAGYTGTSATEEPPPGTAAQRGHGGGVRGRGNRDGGFRGGRGDRGRRGDGHARGRGRGDGNRGRGGKSGRDGQAAGHRNDERAGMFGQGDQRQSYPQPQPQAQANHASFANPNPYGNGGSYVGGPSSNAPYPGFNGSAGPPAPGFGGFQGAPSFNFQPPAPQGGGGPPHLPFNFPHNQGAAGQQMHQQQNQGHPSMPFSHPFQGQHGYPNAGQGTAGHGQFPAQAPSWPQAPPNHQFPPAAPGGFSFPVPPPPPPGSAGSPNPADNAALQLVLNALKQSAPRN